jgi:inner membrane protein
MTGKTHVGIGVIATVILSEYIPVQLSLTSLVICVLASLLPDIDHPKGLINKYILPVRSKWIKVTTYITLGIFILLLNYFYMNYYYLYTLGVLLILIVISTHRNGITHSITGLLCFVGILGNAAVKYSLINSIAPFTIGYGAHIICDMFTNRGVPLLFPFKKTKYKMPFAFSVGSWRGNLFEGIITAAGLIYLVWRLPIIFTKIR